MIDRNKLPDHTYNELIDLFGYEMAEDILNKNRYNFQAIQSKILTERIKRRFGKRVLVYFGAILFLVWIVWELYV